MIEGLTKSIAEQGLLFAVLVAILVGSFYRIWSWTWDAERRLTEMRASYDKQLAVAAERLEESRKDKQFWQAQATRTLGIAEVAVPRALGTHSDSGSQVP